jgi:hypothetical protein
MPELKLLFLQTLLVMALATTVMTSPLLDWIHRKPVRSTVSVLS